VVERRVEMVVKKAVGVGSARRRRSMRDVGLCLWKGERVGLRM